VLPPSVRRKVFPAPSSFSHYFPHPQPTRGFPASAEVGTAKMGNSHGK